MIMIKNIKKLLKLHAHDYSIKQYKISDDKECDRSLELRNAFFHLSLLAISLSFKSLEILMIIMFVLHIKCPNSNIYV